MNFSFLFVEKLVVFADEGEVRKQDLMMVSVTEPEGGLFISCILCVVNAAYPRVSEPVVCVFFFVYIMRNRSVTFLPATLKTIS